MLHNYITVRAFYKKLLSLYPKDFRDRVGESMEQTFNDLLREHHKNGDESFVFLFWVFIETSVGIIKENLAYNNMKNIITNPKSAAFIGFLFILPFVIANTIVANRIEPFFSIIRPGIHTSSFEYVLLFIVVFLIPVGAFITFRPILEKGTDGKRKFYLGNGVLATILLTIFILLSVVLGSEIYRCDILQLPNCD